VIGAHGQDGARPKRRPKNWETFRGRQSGIDPAEVTRQVTQLWHQADSGKAFAASLVEHDYQLCRGDRRDFCIVDGAGELHSLARRIEGVKAAEICARLADLDRESLPAAADAKLLPAVPAMPASPAAPISLDTHLSPLEHTPEPNTPAPVAPGQATGEREAHVSPPKATLSALDRFADEVTAAMRANGGDLHYGDGLTWFDRSIAVLEDVASWAKGKWEELVERPPDEHDPPER
jgi:hypothetical protein